MKTFLPFAAVVVFIIALPICCFADALEDDVQHDLEQIFSPSCAFGNSNTLKCSSKLALDWENYFEDSRVKAFDELRSQVESLHATSESTIDYKKFYRKFNFHALWYQKLGCMKVIRRFENVELIVNVGLAKYPLVNSWSAGLENAYLKGADPVTRYNSFGYGADCDASLGMSD